LGCHYLIFYVLDFRSNLVAFAADKDSTSAVTGCIEMKDVYIIAGGIKHRGLKQFMEKEPNPIMTERPILFSTPMVRALLDGSKTQTRRVVKQLDPKMGACTTGNNGRPMSVCWAFGGPVLHCPYGQPGDRLWARETWRGVVEISAPGRPIEHGVARYVPDQQYCRRVEYAATQERDTDPWRPSIHMPRWASRILLEIISVRVERLLDISEADAQAEGAKYYEPANHLSYGGWSHDEWQVHETAKGSFEKLWGRINGADSWTANPWVWVVEFKRVTP
jgi:hypothetical protein